MISKKILVAQKAPLFRNCGGAKFGDFGEIAITFHPLNQFLRITAHFKGN
jgi:hypothetical protein